MRIPFVRGCLGLATLPVEYQTFQETTRSLVTSGHYQAMDKQIQGWASMMAALRRLFALAGVFALGLAVAPDLALAQKIENPIAVFAALDKVTGRISPLEIPIGVSVEFGALTVTPRVCNTRPPTEPPLTSAFVEIDETKLSGEKLRIFTGWMFAESPGLHAVEHPVFDVWLTNCKTEDGAQPAGNLPQSPEPSNAPSSRP